MTSHINLSNEVEDTSPPVALMLALNLCHPLKQPILQIDSSKPSAFSNTSLLTSNLVQLILSSIKARYISLLLTLPISHLPQPLSEPHILLDPQHLFEIRFERPHLPQTLIPIKPLVGIVQPIQITHLHSGIVRQRLESNRLFVVVFFGGGEGCQQDQLVNSALPLVLNHSS